MSMARKIMVMTALVALAAMVLVAIPGCFGGSSEEELKEEYQRGYEDGVKAEKAKWSDEKLQLARTMIEEQEASQESIGRLLNGEVSSVNVDAVAVGDTTAQVKITAVFKDGTTVPGTVDLVKIDNMWYMQKVTAEQGNTPS
jgi:DNA-binding LacI/PurR family transcriptional regulator